MGVVKALCMTKVQAGKKTLCFREIGDSQVVITGVLGLFGKLNLNSRRSNRRLWTGRPSAQTCRCPRRSPPHKRRTNRNAAEVRSQGWIDGLACYSAVRFARNRRRRPSSSPRRLAGSSASPTGRPFPFPDPPGSSGIARTTATPSASRAGCRASRFWSTVIVCTRWLTALDVLPGLVPVRLHLQRFLQLGLQSRRGFLQVQEVANLIVGVVRELHRESIGFSSITV